jgi:hypothetical protein
MLPVYEELANEISPHLNERRKRIIVEVATREDIVTRGL